MKRIALFMTMSIFAAAPGYANKLGYNQLSLPPKPAMELDCPHLPLMLDAIYFGASLGYDSYRIHESTNGITLSGDNLIALNRINLSGPLLEAFAGYGRKFDWFYIAGEVFGNSSSARGSYTVNEYQTKVNLRYTVGVSILPGIVVNHLGILYARIGAIRTLMVAKESGLLPETMSVSEFANGLQIGAGIETALSYHLTMRTEVRHTQYGSFSSEHSTRFDPSDTQALVSLVYHLDLI